MKLRSGKITMTGQGRELRARILKILGKGRGMICQTNNFSRQYIHFQRPQAVQKMKIIVITQDQLQPRFKKLKKSSGKL